MTRNSPLALCASLLTFCQLRARQGLPMKFFALTAILALALYPAPAAQDKAGSADEIQVRQLERAWNQAEMKQDRKSTRLNSSHSQISYAVFCLKKKKHYEYYNLYFPPMNPPLRTADLPAGLTDGRREQSVTAVATYDVLRTAHPQYA